MNSIRKQVFSGLFWTYLERIAAQIVSLIVSIILARILGPEEYGIISIVTIFVTLSNVFIVNGFGTALIQKKDADSLDFSTVFYSNCIFTLIIYILLFILAPYIQTFYEYENLSLVIRVLSVSVLITAVSSVQQAYITRQMQFKKFFFSTIIGTVISGVVGVWLAYIGVGVWALVAQLLTNRIIDTTILSFTSGWHLTKEFSFDRLKLLVGYSWKIVASSFLIALYDNIRDLIVGKKYSVADLAYYNKGRQFPVVISDNINTSISKVLFPTLSKFQDDNNKIKNMTRRAISISSYVLFPILLGLAAIGRNFITILLTKKWIAVVPFLQVMCIVYMLQPVQTASIQAMKAIGRTDIYLKLEIVKKVFGCIIIVISLFCFNDVFAVALGALSAEVLSSLINMPANKSLLNYTYKEQIQDIIKPLIISGIMTLIVLVLGRINIINIYFTVLIQIAVGTVLYLFLSIIFGVESYSYLKNSIDEYFHRQ